MGASRQVDAGAGNDRHATPAIWWATTEVIHSNRELFTVSVDMFDATTLDGNRVETAEMVTLR